MAAIAIVIVAVCAALAWQALPARLQVHTDAGQAPYENTSRQHCEAKLRALGRNVTSGQRNQDGKEEQRPDDDLCQQIRSAEAAEEAAKFTRWQAWAAFLSVGLVLVATYFTGRAARYAKRAAIAAQSSADADNQSLIEMRLTAERQLRAYVNVAEPTIIDKRLVISFDIGIKNYGQTPAYELRIETGTNIDTPPPRDVFNTMLGGDSSGALAPQAPFVVAIKPDPALDRSAISERDTRVFVFGVIRYVTLGNPHTTTFCVYCDRSVYPRLVSHHYGNDSD